MKKINLNFKELIKYNDEAQRHTVTCECGHRVIIPENRKYRICSWCGIKVYKSEKDKFKEKLINQMKKGK